MESSQQQLPFLDILIKLQDGFLQTDLYTKPTDAAPLPVVPPTPLQMQHPLQSVLTGAPTLLSGQRLHIALHGNVSRQLKERNCTQPV